jgi:hypothetical protein
MPSPFPGMNPYLEQETAWHDFHERSIPVMADMIGAQVLPRYFVKIDEHLYVHDIADDSRHMAGRGDVTVAQASPAAEKAVATQLLEAPAEVLQPRVDEERESFLEIRDRANHRLVTVLELLSPSNKRMGKYRDQYLMKRDQMLAGTVHFVEIDLLRGGPRMPWDNLPACDYYAIVSRAARRPRAGIWLLSLRDRLPPIPIPLHEGDQDATLDLQTVLHRVYDSAGYEVYLYEGQPEPPLSREDTAWATSLLPGKMV